MRASHCGPVPELIWVSSRLNLEWRAVGVAPESGGWLSDDRSPGPGFNFLDAHARRHDPAAEPPLDPSALARFGRLELIARLVVEGVMSGLHKSPFKGFSVEFAEHRQYGPGDEIRHIDWRA